MEKPAPNPASEGRLSAVLLAAGLSRRMGKDNKLLLPIHGVPLVRHVANVVVTQPFVEVVVVTGHDSASIEAALQGLSVRFVLNPDYEEGR